MDERLAFPPSVVEIEPPKPSVGMIIFVSKDTVDVTVGASVLRNVGIMFPLTIEQVNEKDLVALSWVGKAPFVTGVYGHETQPGAGRPEPTVAPPKPKNVRVVQGDFGVRLEWDWGGTDTQRRDLSYYEVDARLPGGTWGYNIYPVSEGTRQVHYSDAGVSVQARVRSVDFRGNESAWVVCSDLLEDSIAPPAPWDLAVDNTGVGAMISWNGPTIQDVADLASYYLYYTDDATASSTGSVWTGTGTKVASVSAGTMNVTYPMEAGEVALFNLTAVDRSGNESALATDAWLVTKYFSSSSNLLTNGDFERAPAAFIIQEMPIAWYCSPLAGMSEQPMGGWPSYSYGGEAGLGGSEGVEIAFAYSEDQACWGEWYWEPASNGGLKVTPVAGQSVIVSTYIKTVSGTWTLRWPDGTGNFFAPLVFTTDGVTAHAWMTPQISQFLQPVEYGIVPAADGWSRVWTRTIITEADLVGKPYLGVGLLGSSNAPLTSPYEIAMDRAQVEFGYVLTDWAPNLTSPLGSGPQGLLIDSSGIRTASGVFSLTSAGKLESNLEPSVSGVYDLGGTNSWDDIRYAGDLLRTLSSVQKTGKVILDLGFFRGSSQVTLSTVAQQLCTSTVSNAPSGSTLLVFSMMQFLVSNWTIAQNVACRLNIGGAGQVDSMLTFRHSGDSLHANHVWKYTVSSTGDLVVQISAWKATADNTVVYRYEYSGALWVLVG